MVIQETNKQYKKLLTQEQQRQERERERNQKQCDNVKLVINNLKSCLFRALDILIAYIDI